MAYPLWTNQEEEKLRELVTEKLTAGQISRIFKTKSRNAIIGKISRLGIKLYLWKEGEAAAIALKNRKKKVKKIKMKKEVKVIYREPESFQTPKQNMITMLQLTKDTCAYPVSENYKELLFCGDKVSHGAYCQHHDEITRQKFKKRL